MKKITIYALADPRDGNIRYVGLTRDLPRRLARYKFRPHSKHLANWFNNLKKDNLFPDVITLCEVEEGVLADESEREWIKFCREAGFNLINFTDGGESAYKMDPAVIAARVGKPRSDRGKPRRPLNEETKRKLSETHKLLYSVGLEKSKFGELNRSRAGIPLSAEHRMAVSNALKGKPKSPDARAVNVRRLKELANDPVERERRREQMKRRWENGHGIPPVPKEVIIRKSNVKLTPDDVRAIRLELENGATNRGLAKKYGVGKTVIGNIRTGQNWSWVK